MIARFVKKSSAERRSEPGYREMAQKKVKAHVAVARARRLGEMEAAACAVCDDPNAIAHHEDYDRPLEVVWLCRSHHMQRHQEIDGESDCGVWRHIGAPQPQTMFRRVSYGKRIPA